MPDGVASRTATPDDGADTVFAALLADPRMAIRPPTGRAPLPLWRQAADAFMARSVGPVVEEVEDVAVEGRGGAVGVRIYRPAGSESLPVIVFLHGGGFVFGGLDSHDAMCRSIAVASAAAVVAVDYRMAPESSYPAALDDVEDVLEWLRSGGRERRLDPARLALAGDSAGGQLAAATALRQHRAGTTPAHLGLIYPMVDPSASTGSMIRFGDDFLLTREFVMWAWTSYFGDDASRPARGDPDLLDSDWSGMCPVTMALASCDPLRDQGRALADAMRDAGVAVEVREYLGMIHGFAGMPLIAQQADDALRFLGSRLGSAVAGEPRVGSVPCP